MCGISKRNWSESCSLAPPTVQNMTSRFPEHTYSVNSCTHQKTLNSLLAQGLPPYLCEEIEQCFSCEVPHEIHFCCAISDYSTREVVGCIS